MRPCALPSFSIHCFHRRPNQFHQFGKIFLRAGLPVDRDSLFDPVEMGRGEQSGAIAGRREHGRHHGRRRALAFGARNVNDRHAVLRVAQSAEQFSHPVELERLFRARHRLGTLVVDPIGEEPQGGLGGGRQWSSWHVVRVQRGSCHVQWACRSLRSPQLRARQACDDIAALQTVFYRRCADLSPHGTAPLPGRESRAA